VEKRSRRKEVRIVAARAASGRLNPRDPNGRQVPAEVAINSAILVENGQVHHEKVVSESRGQQKGKGREKGRREILASGRPN